MSIAEEIRKRLNDESYRPPAVDMANIMKSGQERATGKTTTGGGRASTLQADAQVDLDKAQQNATLKQGLAGAAQIEGMEEAQGAKNNIEQEQLANQQQMFETGQRGQQEMANEQRLAQMDMQLAKLDNNESMKIEQLNNQSSQALNQLATQRNLELTNIWGNFERSNKDLEDREDAADLEQLAFLTRLTDKQYLDTITRIGKSRQLEDELKFKEEAARMSFGNKQDLLRKNIDWMEAFNKGARSFAEEMNSMEIDQAMEIAEATAQQNAIQSVFKGAIMIGGAMNNGSEGNKAGAATGAKIGGAE